jgi:hypothetical protein
VVTATNNNSLSDLTGGPISKYISGVAISKNLAMASEWDRKPRVSACG